MDHLKVSTSQPYFTAWQPQEYSFLVDFSHFLSLSHAYLSLPLRIELTRACRSNRCPRCIFCGFQLFSSWSAPRTLPAPKKWGFIRFFLFFEFVPCIVLSQIELEGWHLACAMLFISQIFYVILSMKTRKLFPFLTLKNGCSSRIFFPNWARDLKFDMYIK